MKGILKGYWAYFVPVLLLPLGLACGALSQWKAPFDMPTWWVLLIFLLLLALGLVVARKRQQQFLPPAPWLWLLTLLAAVYDCSCNIGAFNALGQLPVSIFMSMGVLCLLWVLLRYAALLLWLPFLFLQIAQIVSYEQYGTRINSLVLAESLEASGEELAAYLSGSNLLYFIGAVLAVSLMGVVQVWLMRRAKSMLSLTNAGSLFCAISLVLGAAIPSHHRDDDFYWPSLAAAELAGAAYEAVCHNQATVRQVESLSSPALQPSTISTLKGGEGVVLVLHIGESVRADRMSLNGYERDTTPWLRQQASLINFTDCISAAQDTCQAQIAILTDARRWIYETDPAMKPTTGSVLELFKANGFSVYSFFGRRVGQQLKYDRVVRLLTHCSRERFNAPGSPWTALPQIESVLQRSAAGDNLVLFVNNEGSHTPFYHYDHENPPFTPTVHKFENPASQAQEVNNAYDNTIHYTDEYVRRVCEMLKGRPFVYVYVSDHGEYLGHDGIWGRAALGESKFSYHETDGCRVGMFVLTSPEFDAQHPHFAQALTQLRGHAAMTVGHEHVFHTLLGMFGISTPYYDAKLDLCSPEAQPYSGTKPASR